LILPPFNAGADRRVRLRSTCLRSTRSSTFLDPFGFSAQLAVPQYLSHAYSFKFEHWSASKVIVSQAES